MSTTIITTPTTSREAGAELTRPLATPVQTPPVYGAKRVFDCCVAVVALLALTPLLLLIALLSLALMGRGGILLRQQRIGRDGVPFGCLKFRTMMPDRRIGPTSANVASDRRSCHKSSDDPRHTRFGRALRRFSLDELPQLVNVLRGDMSLVGPRPELVSVASDSFVSHPRHLVRPGLTGSFQVSPLRGTGDLETGLRLDEEYVRKVSLREDLLILGRTVRVLFRGTGS